MNLVLRFLFDASLVPAAALVLVGRYGGFDWLFDMTNYFRPHIAVVAVLFIVLALGAGGVLRLAASVILFGAALVPLLVPALPAAAAAPQGNFRITTANVDGENRNFEAMKQMVAAAAPDILIAQEAGWRWRPTISTLPGLPFVSDQSLDVTSSVMVASRYPITVSVVSLAAATKPTDDVGGSAALRIEVARPDAPRPLVIYGIHPPTTRKARGWIDRNSYLRAISILARGEPSGTDVIVAGDWNTPYWSPVLRAFMKRSQLVTTERGAWPPPTRFFREAGLPPALGTPIDRIAVSRKIGLAAIGVSRDFGSDHLAVTADLAIP
ncbi:MAG TPA: endonuclease/exonuclease/phosphatase family protein [Kaistia sp.]|nr:endonuclease/exonuclease/phosphatase family protein [Kaistia sp.]